MDESVIDHGGSPRRSSDGELGNELPDSSSTFSGGGGTVPDPRAFLDENVDELTHPAAALFAEMLPVGSHVSLGENMNRSVGLTEWLGKERSTGCLECPRNRSRAPCGSTPDPGKNSTPRTTRRKSRRRARRKRSRG